MSLETPATTRQPSRAPESSSAGAAAFFGALSTGAAALLSVVRSKVAAVYLGPAGVGFSAEISQAVALVATAARIFTGPALMKALVETREDATGRRTAAVYRAALTAIAVIGLAGGGLAFSLLTVPLAQVEQSRLARYVAYGAVSSTCAGLVSVATLVLIGVNAQLRRVAILNVAQVTIATVLVVGGTLIAGLEGNLAGLAIAGVVSVWLFHRFTASAQATSLSFGPGWSGELWRNVRTTGVGSLASILGTQAVLTTVRIALEHRGGFVANGMFQSAFAVASLAYTLFGAALNSHAFPRFAAAAPDKVAVELDGAHSFLLRLAPGVIVGVLLVRHPLMVVLFSREFAEGAVVLGFLIVGDFFRAVFETHQGVLLFRGKVRAYVASELLLSGLHMALVLRFVTASGIELVGPVYLASYAVAAMLGATAARRASGVPLRWDLIAWTGAVGVAGLVMIVGGGVPMVAGSAALLLLVSWRFGGLDAARQVARRVGSAFRGA